MIYAAFKCQCSDTHNWHCTLAALSLLVRDCLFDSRAKKTKNLKSKVRILVFKSLFHLCKIFK